MIKLNFLESIIKISDTEEQLQELEKACNTHTFSHDSIPSALLLFQNIQTKIKRNRDISKLKEQSAHLAKISKIFRAHCEKPDVSVVEEEIDHWAKAIGNQERFFQVEQIPPSIKREGLEQQRFLMYKSRIAAALPGEEELEIPLSSYSLSKLLSIEEELKKILQEMPPSDPELEQLWWRKYAQLLPALQSRSIPCGDSASTLTFENEQEASSIFNLMNLGSLDLSDDDLSKNSFLTLSLTIKTLETALTSGEVPENERDAVKRLLSSYKAGYHLARMQQREIAQAQALGTVEAGHTAKQKIKAEILKELRKQGELVLSTGYKARPHGHEIALRLTLEKDGSVSGLVINRGEGVEMHGGECFQGLRKRVTPFMELGKTPLEHLEKSPFLELLTELSFLKIPGEKVETAYKIHDFYSVLETWPGEGPATPIVQNVRGAQRGGTCTLKAYLTPFSHLFSPELARYLKLKMRLDALQLYICHGNPTGSSLSSLEWALKKIHRELRKLEKQTKETETFSEGLKKKIQKEACFCAQLTQRLKKGMKALQEHEGRELERTRQAISVDVVDLEKERIALKAPPEGSDASPKKTEILTDPLSFKTPAEAVNFLMEVTNGYSKLGAEFFFKSLPSCSDTVFWSSEKFLELETLENLEMVFSEIQSQGTGQLTIKILNALVGMLHAFKAAETFNKEGLLDRTRRLMGVLQTLVPHLRAGDPLSEEELKRVRETLRELCGGSMMRLELESASTESHWVEYDSLKDPSQSAIWRSLEQRGSTKTCDPLSKFLINLPYMVLSCVRSPHEATQIPFIIAHYPNQQKRLLSLKLAFKPLQKNINEASRCALSHALFPFTPEEERIIQQLLDSRLSFQEKPRKTQNEQLQVSQKPLFFGKTVLSTQEVEGLLSIATEEETLVSQCLRFFSPERFFFRLQDPRFQALLHGFLLTNDESGSSMLGKALQDPVLAKKVVEFFQKGLRESSDREWPETELFFLLLLAHASSYVTDKDAREQCLGELYVSISRLQKTTMTVFEKNRLNHWLVALSPFIVHSKFPSEDLIKVCEEACARLDKMASPYHFNGRLIIKDYFDTGLRIFSKNPLSLPSWIFDHPHYQAVCRDPEPHVERLGESDFQITTHQGDVYYLSTKGPLKISRTCINAAGVTEVFVYVPSRPFERALFTEDTHWWQSEKNPSELLAFSSKDSSLRCRLVAGEILHPLEPHLILASSGAEKLPLLQRLRSLDREVFIWKNRTTHQIEKVEIPHYEMTFDRYLNEKGVVEWKCPRYPGFVLDPHAIVTELEPSGHYFVLQKGKEKRVFFPNQILEAQKATLKAVPISRTRAESPDFFSLPLTQEGRVSPPKDPETLLYLSHTALRLHQYAEAAEWIARLSRAPSYWGEKEKALLIPFFARGEKEDLSPYASALRLRLRLIAGQSGYAYTPYDFEALEKDYLTCLDHLNSLGEQWLSPGEEKLLLKLLKEKKSENLLLKIRSKELESPLSLSSFSPEASRPPSSLKEESRSPFFSPVRLGKFLTLEVVKQMIEGAKKPFPIALHLRPGTPFVYNFLHFYRLAYNQEPDAEIKQLRALLKLARNGKDSTVETFRILLVRILEADSETKRTIPSPDELLKKFEAIATPSSFHEKKILSLFPWDRFLIRKPEEATTRPFDISGLKPKSGIIRLTPSPASPTTPPSSLKKEGALHAKAVRPLEVLLEGGLLRQQDADYREEMRHLKELEALYPKEGKSRLIEGLQERRMLLKASRQKEYLLPITVEQTPQTARQLREVEDLLAEQINESSEEVRILEQELLELSNRRSAELQGEVDADLIQPLNLRQLLLHFARGDEKAILKSNPELAPHLQELKELITDYAVAKTNLQHFLRAQRELAMTIETAQESGWSSDATQHAATTFVSSLIQERAYEPSKHPKILLFEAIGDVRLRKEQYEALIKLSTSGESYELEARTGFGKSKVLIPLWLFMNQEKGRLTVMATTRSLLPDQLLHLRELLGEDLELAVQAIDFDRQKIADKRYLDFVVQQMEVATQEGRILLVDINSLQGMTHLALKQALFKSGPVEDLLKIRRFLTEAFVFIDESTECLGIRKRFDYASGAPSATPPAHCKEAASFYDHVVFSPEVLSHCRLEFLPDQRTDQPIVTEDNYETDVRPYLVQAALRYLKVPEKASKAVAEHLIGKEKAGGEEYYKTLSPQEKERYAYCYKQLHLHLKRSLARRCGERYDCNDKRLAIPYQEGMPRPNSDFANREDMINFTIQANLKRPLDLATIQGFVESCQRAAQTLNPLAVTRNPCYALYLELQKALALPPAKELKKAHAEAIVEYLNSARGHRHRLSFISAFILPKVTTLPYKIPGNVYTVLGPLKNVRAASGTVAPETLPPHMRSLQEKSALTVNVLSLWKNAEHAILTLNTKDGKAFLKELLAKRPKDRVFIDIGGLLRDLSQEEILRLIFAGTKESDPPVRGIAFYNQDRQCMIWERGASAPIPRESSTLPKEEVYTYIRQAHVVGSDTPLSPMAQGTATFSRETGETLFLQGIGRMRGLQSGQIENLVISEEDAQAIRRKLKLKAGTQIELRHLLVYAQQLEQRQRQKDYFFALQAYLKTLLERQIWKKIEPQFLSICFKELQELLLEKTETDLASGLFDTLQELPAKEAVDKMVSAFLSRVDKKLKEKKGLSSEVLNLEEIQSDFNQFVHWGELGKTVSTGETEEETAETESEVTQENETSVESEGSVSTGLDKVPSQPSIWSGDYRTLMAGKGESILGIAFFKSPNLTRIHSSALEEEWGKPAYHYVLKLEESGTSLLAMDLHDATNASLFMKTSINEESDYQLISADGALLAIEKGGERPVHDQREIQIGILTKLLAGDSFFSKRENKWLEDNLPKFSPEELKPFLQLVAKCAAARPHQQLIQEYITEILS